MKLSTQTLQILKSMAQFNENFRAVPTPNISGTSIASVSPDRSVYISAEIEEDITTPVTLYKLPMFLSVVNTIGSDYDIVLSGNYLTVESGNKQKVRINYADKDTLELPKDSKPNFPAFEVEFAVSKTEIASILKFADILGCKDILFTTDDNNTLIMKALDVTDASINTYQVELGELYTEHKFSFVLKREVLKLIDSDYTVKLSSKKLAQFKAVSVPISYYFSALTAHTTWS